MEQGDLFSERKRSTRDRFQEFHEKHPEVYVEFVRRSRVAKSRGMKKCGAWLIWGAMRWWFTFERDEAETFKLNNNYIAHYARLAMEQEPDLAGFFSTRELRAA